MEEKKLPWWRRALSFALGGIRSGFGLFSRSPKNGEANDPQIVAGQEEDSEEAELIEDSPRLEPIAETVHETVSGASVEVAAAEPGSAATESEAVEPQAAAAEEDRQLARRLESGAAGAKALDESGAVAARLKSCPVTEPAIVSVDSGLSEGHKAIDNSEADAAQLKSWPDAEQPEASAESVSPAPGEDAAVGGFETANEAQDLSEPEAVVEPEVEARIEESEVPEPEPEPETEAVAEEVAASEPSAETPPDELAEEGAVPTVAPDQLNVEPEMREDPVEAPALSAVVDEASAETAVEASGKVAGEAAKEDESAADAVVNHEAPQEAPVVGEMVPGPGEEPRESAKQDAEVEAVPEADAVTGPTESEESTFADEPVLEEDVSPVELKEPAIEEPPEQTAGQPAANEAESPEQAAPVAEAAPEAEPAIELVAEIDPEPAKISMELNEPIREQASEPTAASETAPVAQPATEEAAGFEAPVPEAAGAPAAVPAETVVEDSAVAAIAAEAPPAEAAVEPAVEDAALPAQEPTPAAPQKPFIKLESRDNEADLSPFSVVVSQVYDGPLDLLLDLIRKQDIDIYDIPIARITAQFLAYVNQLKATDVDVAGEFIYTASLLIHIKSKMLLPRAPAGPDDAAEDPRRELVERLLEHERFKNAAQMLQQKQMLESATWTNPGLREFQDDAGAEPEIAADTVDLVRVFRDILERARNRPVINVEEDSVTVGQMIQFLSRRLTMEDKPVALRRLLSHTRSERALIAMFLALLELVRLQAILLRQDRAFSEIFIKKQTGFESVMNDGLASARDDWR